MIRSLEFVKEQKRKNIGPKVEYAGHNIIDELTSQINPSYSELLNRVCLSRSLTTGTRCTWYLNYWLAKNYWTKSCNSDFFQNEKQALSFKL